MSKEINPESFSDRIESSVLRANFDSEESFENILQLNRKWYHPLNFLGSGNKAKHYPINILFYFLKLDKIKWKVRIPKWVGLAKEDVYVPGAMLVLYAVVFGVLFWAIGYFI